MTLHDTIEERVRNAYAAGHNDARKGTDRADEVAARETERIIAIVRETLLSPDAVEALAMHIPGSTDDEAESRAQRYSRELFNAAFPDTT